MQNKETTTTRVWVTVDDAFLACQLAGLERTKKTIRSWCRNHHVEAQKQTTPTGERWVLDEASLLTKIEAEKQMQAQFAPVQPSANPSEPLPDNAFQRERSEPVQPRANQFDPVRTGADSSEQTAEIAELESKLRSLEIDKAVRDKQIEFLTKQNAEGHENLMSQSRYIGHLETRVLELGGRPDQTFLSAPKAQAVDSQHAQDPRP
ncbi:MAG TPA: hypothetical protein ENK28_00880 [Aliiroseovarius sp.]|nr:hypothetical protein [Aliiroseovarius sp.]